MFKHRTGKLYGKWTQLWRMSFLTKADNADLSMDGKVVKFGEAWQTFCAGALPKLTAAIAEAADAEGEPI